MGIIKAKNVVHEFFRRDEEGNVESITTTRKEPSFVWLPDR